MKKKSKKSSSERLSKPLSTWQFLLQQLLTPREYKVLTTFNNLGMEGACTELKITHHRCSSLLKSSLRKLSVYYRMYREIDQKSKIHVFTKRQFLAAPLKDIGFSTRTYHLLKGADLYNMIQVLSLGTKGLSRIKGFGEKAMIELKSMLRYKGCLDLLVD